MDQSSWANKSCLREVPIGSLLQCPYALMFFDWALKCHTTVHLITFDSIWYLTNDYIFSKPSKKTNVYFDEGLTVFFGKDNFCN